MKKTYWPFAKYQKIIPLRPSALGVVQREPVRCGKRNCICVNGRPHYGYYHYFRDPLTKLRFKRYIPRFAVCKLKQRLRYWKNKYYFWNYMPGKTIVYSGVPLDKDRMSLFYKRLHILTEKARVNLTKIMSQTDEFQKKLYENEWNGEPYRYLLRENEAPATSWLDLLLKSVKKSL